MRALLLSVLLLAPAVAHPLSREAEEFIQITKELEPVQCEKRQLRRKIALAEIEKRDARDLHRRFGELNRDPKTAKLEKRLGVLGARLQKSADAEDLPAINRQRVEAFYRCE